jgi:hypothetical protein
MIITRCYYLTLSTLCFVLINVDSFSSPRPKLEKIYTPPNSATGIDHRTIEYSSLICTLSSLVDCSVETSPDKRQTSVRSRLRKMTGFSMTALRATTRAATGISLTALYLSAVAVSGVWIRQAMKVILAIFPTWARYFVQPFLVMYYVPLFMLRSLTSPQRSEQKQTHDSLVESWKQAVTIAEQSNSYWPIHLNENDSLETVTHDVDVVDAVAKSVEVALEKQS